MPTITQIRDCTRGTTLTFTTTFTAANGAALNPPAANLNIWYSSNGANVLVSTAMSNTANGWTATWDSSNADVGVVQWNILCTGTTKVSQDGEFRINGNDANFRGFVW